MSCQYSKKKIILTEFSTTTSTTTTTPRATTASTSKREVKQNYSQTGEDDDLWHDLRSGAAVVRSERQQQRFQKWVTAVAGKSGKFEIVDELTINCTACKNHFTVNKFNALDDLGKTIRNVSESPNRLEGS